MTTRLVSDPRYEACQCITPDRSWYVWDTLLRRCVKFPGGYYYTGSRTEAVTLAVKRNSHGGKKELQGGGKCPE